jgi:hypothetical protein
MALSYTAVFAQEAELDHNGPVAIIVVDVFEPYGKLFPIPPEHTGENPPNCTLVPEAMDNYQYGGGSLVDYTTAGAPMQDIHGRLVYSEIQSLLRRRGAAIESHTTGTAPIRDIEVWRWREDDGDGDTDDDVIVLAAFDVSDENLKYDSNNVNAFLVDALAGDLNLQIQAAGLDAEIQSYVINMSFGLIPCNRLQGFTLEEFRAYAATLAQGDPFYAALNDLFNSLMSQAEANGVENAFIQIISLPEFAPLLNQAFNDLMRPKIQGAFEEFYGQFEANPEAILSFFADDPLMAFINESYSDGGALAKRLRGTPAQGNGPNYIMVASAGNEGYRFPYAPAIARNVISVSAEYPDVNVCRDMLTAAGTGAILSNRGEVMMNGFYNCLPGTSFAAPKLSFEMALYLLRGGETVCNGNYPPLAYARADSYEQPATLPAAPANRDSWQENIWRNLPRIDAADEDQCPDFNALAGVP